jgi:hypothetical protein
MAHQHHSSVGQTMLYKALLKIEIREDPANTSPQTGACNNGPSTHASSGPTIETGVSKKTMLYAVV